MTAPLPTRVSKPPYLIPPTAEILAVPSNGYTVLSTFSGTGGVCLGYRWAGFDVVAASEFVAVARETYRANFPNTPIDARDIRNVDGSELLALGGVDAVDVLEGSPPCASFSMAGRREENWGKTKKYSEVEQRVDDLFDEFVRVLREIRPRVFTAENVTGLTKGVARGYLRQILDDMTAAGYRVKAATLDSQFLGVPQARQRIVFVGYRDDLDLEPSFPTPRPYRYSVGEALADVPVPTSDETSGSFTDMAIGREWRRLRQGESSDRYFRLTRASFATPLPTLTATASTVGAASVTHPSEPRKFSIPELRRLSGFPDDWVLVGSYRQRAERLGRAVPPPMAKAVADVIAADLAAVDRRSA